MQINVIKNYRIIKTELSKQNYQNRIIKTELSKQNYQNRIIQTTFHHFTYSMKFSTTLAAFSRFLAVHLRKLSYKDK